MYIEGYSRIGSGVPIITLGNIDNNVTEILSLYDKAAHVSTDLLVLPELCITGYSMADMFHQKELLNQAEKALLTIADYTKDKHPIMIVGLPLLIHDAVYNCGAAIHNGKILGIVPKSYLPTYNEFYETRWFADASHLTCDNIQIGGQQIPIGTDLLFKGSQPPFLSFGMEICEDLWVPVPPSTHISLQGAYVIANLSASNDLILKGDYRKDLVKNQSAKMLGAYVYTSAGFGESTTDVSYQGHCLIAENGSLVKEDKQFSLVSKFTYADIDLEKLQFDRYHSNTYRECRKNEFKFTPRTISFSQTCSRISVDKSVPPHPFVPANALEREQRCEEIFSIQTTGLAKRLNHIGSPKAIIGISGGLDSTLALLVTVKTFDLLGRDRKDIIGVTMPGFGTTDRTYNNAIKLMESLHITIKEISIVDAVNVHFKDILHDSSLHDITYENSQARERTQILMDLSNKYNGIVIGTGDLSELALGWATYNGDHMSMYAVNTSIPKTLVRYLVEWIALKEESRKSKLILCDILETPVSPELLPPTASGKIKQKTEEVVGPYELHDFFLYYMLRFGFAPKKIFALACSAFSVDYPKETIFKWLKVFYRRFFQQQFKRSALPDGPKVGSICLSPRGDLRMPSDTTAGLWMNQLDALEKTKLN